MEQSMTGPDTKQVRAEMTRVLKRGARVPDQLRNRAAEMLRNGVPNAEIKKALGVSESVIKDVAQGLGIYRGPGGRVITKAESDAINAKRAATKAPAEEPADEATLKGLILRLIADQSQFPDVATLCTHLRRGNKGVQAHEVTHLLYSLSKMGLVKFTEQGRTLVRIRATQHAYDTLGYPKGAPVTVRGAGANWQAGHALLHPRPGDPTDYHNQPTKAPGGHITRSRVPIEPTAPAPPAPPVAPPPAPPVAPEPDDKRPVVAQPYTVVFGTDPHPTYPEIGRLLARTSKLREAAAILEAAGQDDLALQTLAKIDDLSPLEQEVLRLVGEAGWNKP